MTIDEIKESVRTLVELTDGDVELCHEVNKCLNELGWWRGQDLIRREDVQKKFALKHHLVDMLNEIPKAEPPKENE